MGTSHIPAVYWLKNALSIASILQGWSSESLETATRVRNSCTGFYSSFLFRYWNIEVNISDDKFLHTCNSTDVIFVHEHKKFSWSPVRTPLAHTCMRGMTRAALFQAEYTYSQPPFRGRWVRRIKVKLTLRLVSARHAHVGDHCTGIVLLLPQRVPGMKNNARTANSNESSGAC